MQGQAQNSFTPVRLLMAAVTLAACTMQVATTIAQPAAPTATPGLVAPQPTSGRFVPTERGFMIAYTETIPGTSVKFEMVPVPGGEFLLGSPAGEKGRGADEGPQVRVRVAPFWIGKCEVTWAEYQAYMAMYDVFKKLQRLAVAPVPEADRARARDAWRLIESHAWDGNLKDEWNVDAVTTATPLYDASFTYSAGEKPNQPAVTMTQFAARQYTKWLSGILGRDFRLPTEAEWEYAARAGTTTAYSFGDDASKLPDHAWFDENGDYQTHPVGTKQPNPWGLYDMHGNVAEWTLDEYQADAYATLAKGPLHSGSVDAAQAVRWPSKLYPRTIRGGSWLDAAALCRSAARQKSEEDEWKLSDPNLPLSPWWYTEEVATGVGMRIIRPLEPLPVEEKRQVWEPDVEGVRQDVRDRLKEGRGVLGVADPSLPAAIEAVKKIDAGK
jgi:formylglycine-generating enzyme required for sulfatase activity